MSDDNQKNPGEFDLSGLVIDDEFDATSGPAREASTPPGSGSSPRRISEPGVEGMMVDDGAPDSSDDIDAVNAAMEEAMAPRTATPRKPGEAERPRSSQQQQRAQHPQSPQRPPQGARPVQRPSPEARTAARAPNSEQTSATRPAPGSGSGNLMSKLPVAFRKDRAGAQGEARRIVPSGRDITAGSTKEAGSSNDQQSKGRIGERLVSMGIITADQLNVALQEKKISGKLLGAVLVELGFITDDVLTSFLAETSGYEVFNPKQTIVDADALKYLEKEIAIKLQVLPVAFNDEGEVLVAMADPYDVVALDTLRRIYPKGTGFRPMVTTGSTISDAIDAAYGYANSIGDILKELEEEDEIDMASLSEAEAYTHPVVRLVNALVSDAVKTGCSDLHFEPEENFVRLRNRKDGVLFTCQILHKQHWNAISQRLKIMSGMNIADKLNAQDGRFNLNVGGREADFRVSSLPTVWGENIVLRVLDKSQSIMPLEGLGFSPENLKKIRKAQSRPEGIIIVTGPTGSGKTTSLYSMLNEINDVEVNIQTLEDPVEYSLPMIRQTHVREGVLEFADGIKALLRQDPDIIFIGEIRDGETANMALKAAMTGHQVYSTLHTNDSFGAIPRVLDLGLKPGMLAGALIAVFAQRLVRRLCGSCKEEYVASAEECEILGVDATNPPTICRAHQGGCQVCAGQGYKGRVAIAEILLFDEDLDEVIASEGTKADLQRVAKQKGFKSMKDDGMLKVLDGLTSIEEVAKKVNINS